MKLFPTEKTETLKARLRRFLFNLYPAIRGTGGRFAFISDDWHEVHTRLPLNLRTRNYVGTIFGGSMMAMADPVYMVMLINLLGPDYVVWDKAASIRFVRPARKTLRARFVVQPEQLEAIRAEVAARQEMELVLPVYWEDQTGTLHARLEKTLYIASKSYYQQKQQNKKKQKAAETPGASYNS
jgi:acyl-coenzyme A thioesterase PaaI-like protein